MRAPTHYRSQDGRLTKLTEMADVHLDNAIAKHTRTGLDRPALVALQTEKARRTGTKPPEQPQPMGFMGGAYRR